MESLTNGHHYITIVQGVSQGCGQAYYDVDTKELIDIENKETIDVEFLRKVTNLIDYIISTRETPYTYEEFCNILVGIKSLCHYKNSEECDEKFGFPKGCLCYDDESEYPNETPSEHINNMENEYLQCDNADVFIVIKELWPVCSFTNA